MSEDEHELGRTQKLNTNSYISVGIVVLIIGGIVTLLRSQADISLQMERMRSDNLAAMSEMKVSMATLQRDIAEKTGDRWSSTDMFHWAVKLQRVNSEGGIKLIVPDPEKSK